MIMAFVKDKIRNEIAKLGGKKFDYDGCGALPMRPDVAFFSANDLFPPFDCGISVELLDNAGQPDILMSKDGTIELSFAVGQRELLLTIQCGGVVTWIKVFEDGQTSIEGTMRSPWVLNGPGASNFGHFEELGSLLNWVATGLSS